MRAYPVGYRFREDPDEKFPIVELGVYLASGHLLIHVQFWYTPLTEEVLVVKVSPVVGFLSCALFVGLGLSNAALASENSLATDETKAQQHSERKGNLPGLFKQDTDTRKGIHTMEGEVLRVEGDHYVVKRNDGREVSLHIDDTTQGSRTFTPGEWIKAKVTQAKEGHHALSISPAPSTTP